MKNTMLLECIWNGEIFAAQSDMSKEISRLLGLTLPIRAVPLGAKSGINRSCVFSENIELLPEINLGDVLAEELSVDVPQDSLVAIFNERHGDSPNDRRTVSSELGILIGDTLLNLVRDCVFPIQCETAGLQVLVNSYCDLIDCPEFQKQGVCSQGFRDGLILSLKEYCGGKIGGKLTKIARTHQKCENATSGTLHPKSVGNHVGRQTFDQKSINLTKLYQRGFKGKGWKKTLSDAVMGEVYRDSVLLNNYYG